MADINVIVQESSPINVIVQESSPIEVILDDMVKESYFKDEAAGDGSTVVFATTYEFRANSLLVFLSGILQEKDVDYTESSDRDAITFATAPKLSRKILMFYVVRN